MRSSKKEALNLSSRDLMLLQLAIKSYVAPPNLQDEMVALYDRLDKHLQR